MADLKSEPGEGLTSDASRPFEPKKSIGNTQDFKHLSVGQCHREGWYCWVCDEDCFSKVFDSLQARLSHYEEYHPHLILRCRIPECPAKEFVREADRAKHMTKAHASVGLEIILKLFQKGVTDKDVKLEGNSGTPPYRLTTEQNFVPSTGTGLSGEVSVSRRPVSILSGLGSNPDPATNDSSGTSMTDPFWVEGAYDCDDILDAAEQQLAQIHAADPEPPSRSALTAMDRILVDKLMKEFWSIFNGQWSANMQLRGKGSASRTQSISSQTSKEIDNQGNSCRQGQKHGRTDENQNSLNEERNSKQAKPSPIVNDDLLNEPFACPYRKHDPRKYNHNNLLWRTCALKGFSTIPRLKAHLYRNHRNFQCQRCKKLFANDEGPHFRCVAVESSVLGILDSQDDSSGAIEKELRSLKTACRDQLEVDRWKEIYQLMFPQEEIPGPYFEAIQYENSGSVNPDELSEYEAYFRRELLRVFKNALEMAIAKETKPVEHRMRSQLISMIRECQELVFSI